MLVGVRRDKSVMAGQLWAILRDASYVRSWLRALELLEVGEVASVTR